MGKLTADEVLTQQHVRGFVGYGPARPGTTMRYYGVAGGQYFFVESVENPVQGDISPINVPDPLHRKRYRRVGRTTEAPDFGTYDLMVGHKHGTLPKVLGTLQGCPVTTILTTGRCKNPSDLNRGYESYLYLMANGEVTDRDNGDMFPQDSDDPLMTTLSVVTPEQYGVGPLAFGETAAPEINAEVIDVVVGPPRDCDGCDSGTSRIYAITTSIGGSPTYQAELLYSVDGGLTWASMSITGLGATAAPTAIDVAGDYLVVLANSTNALFYSLIDSDTGIPDTTWTQVTSGFATGGNPNDLYVAGPADVWIVGNGGYIYHATDVTAGVDVVQSGSVTTQNLLRVHGTDETVVAVGAAQTVLFSTNGGATWGTPQTAIPTSANATAVCVKDDEHWWVGFGNGAVYYTVTSGKTWTAHTGAVTSATAVYDIVFPTDHVGYIAYTQSGPTGKLACTVDGGDTWVSGAARITGTFPTHDRTNRIGIPASDPQTDANMVVLGGLAGDGSDGILFIGAANIV